MTRGWLIFATAILIGMAVGLGGFTFVYAKGYSYLTNDPSACANCHVMEDHFAAWSASSHSAHAGCNDCHTPHGSVIEKYAVKAKNGFWHSFYFTTGEFPDPIRITEANAEIVEEGCRYCHASITETIEPGVASAHDDGQALDCTRCHQYVGHMVR
jgi:cytochrome c nitrite reductase small subunit